MPRLMIWALLFFCFCEMISFAQDKPAERYLEVRGISELEMKPLGKATAHLYDGTKEIQNIQTGPDGSFVFKLEINKLYTIEVEKNGLISKRINFNTTMPDDEKGSWINEFSIGLVKYCDGVDYSPLKEPVDIVKFDPKRREFLSDKEYVNRMRPKLESVLMKYDQCMMDKYDAAIKKGDQALARQDVKNAIAGYQEALEIYPRETYPTKQINEINKQSEKQQKSSEQAERKELLDKEEHYNLALAKASVAYTRKDYTTARQYYQEALAIKSEETIPRQRLQEIETLLSKKASEDAKIKEVDKAYKLSLMKADSLLKSKNYQSAREQYAQASAIKPGEGYPRAKSLEIDKIEEASARSAENAKKQAAEKEYQDLLNQADNQFKAKSYDEAKASYSKALAMKPADPYPSQRVKLVENTITAEKQSAREDQSMKEYREIIGTADLFFEAKEFDKAREAYSKALVTIPDDKYAQSRITAIENMIAADMAAKSKAREEEYKSSIGAAKTAIAQKSYSQARELLQKALAIKPGDAYATNKMGDVDKMLQDQQKIREQEELKKNQYNESVTKADKLLQAGDLTSARHAYEEVLQIKPGDSYASQQITAIDNQMSAKAAARLRQTDSAYSSIMAAGTELLLRKDFAKARESFQKALTIKPGDPSASNKLRDVEVLIAQEQERISSEQAKKKSYNDALARADQQMNQKLYGPARQAYEEALEIMPGEAYPRQKIDEISTILREQDEVIAARQAAENAYMLAIGNADKYFNAKDFFKSKEEYTRAMGMKPDEEYPKSRLAELEKLISAQQQEQAALKVKADAYASAINKGNEQFAGKNYTGARINYKEALEIMPDDKLARAQIARIDKILIASRTAKAMPSTDPALTKDKPNTVKINELNFRTESERQKYQDELKKKYPAGITLEKYHEQYKEILRYIIIRDNQAMDYRQTRFLTYNGLQYSVNGTSVTQLYFLSQVKTRQGESFQEIDMQ